MSSQLISQPLKPANTLESPEIHCKDGKIKASLNVLEPSPESPAISGTISSPSRVLQAKKTEKLPFQQEQKIQISKKECVIAAYPPELKSMTLQDKSTPCKKSTLNLKLSRTLDPALTSKGKVFSTYSKEQLKEISRRLWFPIETDSQDSVLNSSNGSLITTESNSWFSNRALEVKNPSYVKTCSPSSTSFPVELTAPEDTKRKKTKPKRVKINFVHCCNYTIAKRIEGIMRGRECGNVLIEGEYRCPKHKDKEDGKFQEYWPYCCEAIIKKRGTGISEERNKKGLKCGEFCGSGEMYCKAHKKTATKPKDPIMRCIKVRARPNLENRKMLQKCFGGVRKTYNLVHENLPEGTLHGRLDKFQKDKLAAMYKREYVTNCPEYLKGVPKDIRGKAVDEYFTGIVNAYNMYDRKIEWERIRKERYQAAYVPSKPALSEEEEKLRKEKYQAAYVPSEPTLPETKYKTKRDQQCIEIPSKNTSAAEVSVHAPPEVYYPGVRQRSVLKIYPRIFPSPIALDRRAYRNKTLRKILDSGIQYDYKLILTQSGKYYFCLPYAATTIMNNSSKQAACDPGIKTFQTVYSPQGELREFGHNANKIIKQYHSTSELFKSQYFHGKLRGDSTLKHKRFLLQDRLKNMINDLHHKTAHTLCSSYNTVVIPHFATSQMVKKEDMGRDTKKEMLTLAHGQFRMRLISKALLLGCTIIVPENEYGTTMTCGVCFSVNGKVGISRVYNCSKCKLQAGRDINAARNVFIRQLVGY